ncbi:hypothetical protein A4H97_05275 [Niastella yeongjuensis]|uniref:Uncharacterized protein n=1 Tax=Niastella yeongjuensis TaxID=354355 RepID=A0A1V9ELL0_9BACT|nr:hypothetical protein A4H97_05275 [Niastella yeongjuensis]
MKLKCWIGPLLGVIILLLLRQMLYDEMENEQPQSAIPAAIEKKKPEISTPMASTLLIRDTLPF